MAVEVISNPRGDVEVPTPSGSFAYEMIFDAGRARAWADSVEELLTLLIPGYDALDLEGRLRARAAYAADVRTRIQSSVLAENIDVPLTAEQAAAVESLEPTGITLWDADVPLVVIDLQYAPYTPARRPSVADGSNLLVIEAYDENDFVQSLHNYGWISVGAREARPKQT